MASRLLSQRPLLALALAGAAVLAGALFFGRSAGAHAVQIASDPAPNQQLAEPPTKIAITFSESVEPSVSSIQLYDQSAKPVTIGKTQFPADKQMSADVPTKLAPGIYTVIWRNLSTVDGHTWAGSFPFTVLGPNGEVPQGTALQPSGGQPPSNRPSTLDSVARWVVLLSTSVTLGGAAYVLFVAGPASRRLSPDSGGSVREISRTVLLITGTLAAFFVLEGSLLQIVVQADRLGGLGRADNLLLDTRSGHFLLARQGLVLVALMAMTVAWRARSRIIESEAFGALLVASVGVLLTQSMVSHAAAGQGPFWTTTIDVLHLGAAALWIGMLVHVGLAMPRWLDGLKGPARTLFAADSFRRFSIIAALSVVALISSGVLSALAEFRSWQDLWRLSYGWALVAKIAVILPLLAVAGANAFFLRSRVEAAALHIAGGADDDARAKAEPVLSLQRLLANTVRMEAALAVLVLAASAVLIQLEPPRAAADVAKSLAAQQPAGPASRGFITKNAEAEGIILALKITPGTLGQNAFELGLGSEFGSIGEVIDTRLDFQNATANTGQSSLPLQLAGSAKFTADGTNLSLPGDWTITATVHRRDADDVRANFSVSIADGAAGGPGATSPVAAASGGRYDWPFDGARSIAAIAVLAAVGAGGALWGVWRIARRRAH